MNEPMVKTKPLKFKNLNYFGMLEGWFWIHVFMFSIDIISHRLAYVFMHEFLFVLLKTAYAPMLPQAISIQTIVVCLYFMKGQLCTQCMYLYYYFLLKPALWRCMGENYNNKKGAKKRHSKITCQYEKKVTHRVFKSQSNDSRKIVSASQCGILASESTLTLSFAW